MREVPQLATTRHNEEVAGRAIEEVPAPDFGVIESRDKSVERLRLLWEERRLFAKAMAAGLVLGVLLAFSIPKHYESTVQLMPPDSGDSSGMALGMAAMAGGGGGMGSGLGAIAGDLLGLKNTGAEFVGILRSRTVQDRLVDKFNLQKVYREKYKEDACQDLSGNSDISEDRKSGIISIEVTDKDPQRAAAIAQAYVDELDRLAAEVSTSAAHRERVFLEGRLQEVKSDLDKASVAFSQFASKNTAIDIEEQAKAMVGAAAAVQGQLIAQESELKALEQIYAANNVRVRSAKANIAELRAQLEKLGGEPGGGASPSHRAGDSQYPSIRQLPILGVTYFDLFRKAKIQEAVYEALTQQYEMAKVQEAKETPSVKVLDSANLPEKKSFPPRLLIILLCSCFALAGSVFWVLAQARWQRTDPKDPGKVLAGEVLQSVSARMPWSAPNGSRLHAMTHKAWIRLARRPGPGNTASHDQ
jgi:capsule polysaccharide export protein KpsE/RkpR